MPDPLPQRDPCEEQRDQDPDVTKASVYIKTFSEATADQIWTQLTNYPGKPAKS